MPTLSHVPAVTAAVNVLISLNTDHEWSPHSPDLNPLDFWFWGDAKNQKSREFGDAKNIVYANKPVTLAQLKENVEAFG